MVREVYTNSSRRPSTGRFKAERMFNYHESLKSALAFRGTNDTYKIKVNGMFIPDSYGEMGLVFDATIMNVEYINL